MTDIGIFYFATDRGMAVADVARECEARGYESLWLPEHTHIPVARRTPYPGGTEMPEDYARIPDPFVSLAAAAAATERLRLATGVALTVERDTIVLAKEVATLDAVSAGRVVLGVGAGWLQEEAENHGVEWSSRFRLLEEQVRALRTIWTEEVAAFDGEHVRFEGIWSWPKPVQDPLPIVIGGETEHTLRRVVEHADGWVPRSLKPEPVVEGTRRLRQMAEDRGRDPSTISVNVFAPPPRAEVVERFQDLDVDRLVFWIPPGGEDDVCSRLDRYAAFIG